MGWDTLLEMLGTGGLVALANWFIGLKAARKKSILNKDDISRLMAEKDNETILKLYNENRNILEKLASLEGMLYKLVVCKHYDSCPVRSRLQVYKDKFYRTDARQFAMEQKGIRYPRDNPTESCTDGDTDGQPP